MTDQTGEPVADEPERGTGSDGPPSLAARVEQEIATLDKELAEIDLLIQQAATEGERHEAKRAALATRIAAYKSAAGGDPTELAELNAQLVNLTRRATVMEAQVDVLNGKAKVLRRYRDGLASLAEDLRALPDGGSVDLVAVPVGGSEDGAAGGSGDGDGSVRVSPTVSRMILAAQEDLRRDIARAMHDGPAQSLTNIILQAQIVERLIASDPAAARPETRELIAMVQSTLDATKSFIFDVRPMVLDDLGLVPTLRRAARDRGRRAGLPVDFESLGTDRRLSMELESGIFRMMEESLAGYLSARPDRVVLRLDWGPDSLEGLVRSVREAADSPVPIAPIEGEAVDGDAGKAGRSRGKARPEPELPAALAAMIEERRDEKEAADAAIVAPVPLPTKSWRDIVARAATLGAQAELSNDGSQVRILVDLPAAG